MSRHGCRDILNLPPGKEREVANNDHFFAPEEIGGGPEWYQGSARFAEVSIGSDSGDGVAARAIVILNEGDDGEGRARSSVRVRVAESIL